MKSLIEKLGIDFPQKLDQFYRGLGYTSEELSHKIQNNQLSFEEGKRVYEAMVNQFCTKEGPNGEKIFDEETFLQILAIGQQVVQKRTTNSETKIRRLKITKKILNESKYHQKHSKN